MLVRTRDDLIGFSSRDPASLNPSIYLYGKGFGAPVNRTLSDLLVRVIDHRAYLSIYLYGMIFGLHILSGISF